MFKRKNRCFEIGQFCEFWGKNRNFHKIDFEIMNHNFVKISFFFKSQNCPISKNLFFFAWIFFLFLIKLWIFKILSFFLKSQCFHNRNFTIWQNHNFTTLLKVSEIKHFSPQRTNQKRVSNMPSYQIRPEWLSSILECFPFTNFFQELIKCGSTEISLSISFANEKFNLTAGDRVTCYPLVKKIFYFCIIFNTRMIIIQKMEHWKHLQPNSLIIYDPNDWWLIVLTHVWQKPIEI